ncbi:PREDICTED: uncharacterized protein LOC107327427 [Acropora digitifera]|uniref:uncharacterized protein LOC107327427 n=1 Tax=Acropora digitifera TaxID=70779 RepID=UPI00077ADBF2|nr:PREDICTED: uncharacterized protein LOC107327427 [Acropora digitifera]
MQDEALLEVSLEALSSRVQELKESIQAFLLKLEQEQMNWPSVLDNYALLSGQVNTLTKLLKNEKTPFFRNLVLLPLLVQQDADPDIQVITKKLYNFISSLSQGLNSSLRIFFSQGYEKLVAVEYAKMLRTATETYALQTLIVALKDFAALVVLTRKNAVITASALYAGKKPTVPLKNSVVIVSARQLLVDNVILIQIVVVYLRVAVRESVPRGVLLIASTKQPYSVPDYLRTKFDPEIEESERKLETMATNIPPEQAQKQIDSLNELASNLNELIKNAREDWEGEQNEGNATHLIILNGGFSVSRTLGPQGAWTNEKSASKAPSSVKVETKTSANVHPYASINRPNSRTGP